jgi:hypothetical protein
MQHNQAIKFANFVHRTSLHLAAYGWRYVPFQHFGNRLVKDPHEFIQV